MARPKVPYYKMNASQIIKEIEDMILKESAQFMGSSSISDRNELYLRKLVDRIQQYNEFKGFVPEGLKFHIKLNFVKLNYWNDELGSNAFINRDDLERINTWYFHYFSVIESFDKYEQWLEWLLKAAKKERVNQVKLLKEYQNSGSTCNDEMPYLVNQQLKKKLYKVELSEEVIKELSKLSLMSYKDCTKYLMPLLNKGAYMDPHVLIQSKEQAEYLVRKYCSWYNNNYKRQITKTRRELRNEKRRKSKE